MDTWAIVYLNLEAASNLLEKNLRIAKDKRSLTSNQIFKTDPPAALLKKTPAGYVQQFGPFGSGLVSESEALTQEAFDDPMVLWQKDGMTYLADILAREDLPENWSFAAADYVGLWEVSLHKWLHHNEHAYQKTIFYVASKQGQLLYSNLSTITTMTISNRPLFQKFVKAPFVGAQLEFEQNGTNYHGVYRQIQDTNIILFMEVPTAVTMAPVHKIVISTSAYLIAAIIVLFFAVQFPIRALNRPMRKLVDAAQKIGRGEYNVTLPESGICEISLLSQKMGQMATNLHEKESALGKMIEIERQKVRLSEELKVAQTIQDNLLPRAKLAPESRLEIASHYEPADECAGDWFHYDYFPHTDETVVALADVTGHGTGAAMYTAMISAIFHDHTNADHGKAAFSGRNFLTKLNDVFVHFGRKIWCSTFVILVFKTGDEKVKIYAAGSTPILHFSERKSRPGGVVKTIGLPSDLIGITADPDIYEGEMNFRRGDLITIMSDGIIESKNGSGKAYGYVKAKKVIKDLGQDSAQGVLQGLLTSNRDFSKGVPQEDDFCILCIKHAS